MSTTEQTIDNGVNVGALLDGCPKRLRPPSLSGGRSVSG
jgi:hypothetical protein